MIDFAKIPTEEVERLYEKYQSLPGTGNERKDFRAKHLDLDAWLVLAKGYIPIGDKGNPNAVPTPWEEKAAADWFKNLF